MSEHKTKEEILLKYANDSSYSDWGEFMYDSHPHTQIESTCNVMQLYADQQASLLTQQLADKIKVEFSDECINEKLRTPDVKSGMIEMRDEILNRLK